MKNKLFSIYFQIGILSISFFILYHETIIKLVEDWSNDDNYSHGFFVPIITAYMIWSRKNTLLKHEVKQNHWGILFILIGVAIHTAGNIGAELFTMRFAIVLTLWALSFYIFGTRISLKIAVPFAYLLFMIPIPAIIWNQLAFPLQLFASKLTTQWVQFIGIPIYREGNVLHLTTTTLEVVDACSGLRSLTALLALSGALAYNVSLKNLSKWILFLAAVPIAIFVNIIRLTVTAVMAQYIGEKAAQGFLHDGSGLLIFGLALVLLFSLFRLLKKIEVYSSHTRSTLTEINQIS